MRLVAAHGQRVEDDVRRLFLTLLLMMFAGFGWRLEAALAGPDVDHEYSALVATAKGDPQHVDFARLRELYAKSSFYRKDASDPMNLRVPGATPSADAIEKFVSDNYGLLSTHIVAVDLLKYGKDTPAFTEHLTAATMIFAAIAKEGDGQSAKTAFKVLAISEEYDICALMRVHVDEQAVMTQDGTSYDVLTVTGGKGDKHELWFDISAFY